MMNNFLKGLAAPALVLALISGCAGSKSKDTQLANTGAAAADAKSGGKENRGSYTVVSGDNLWNIAGSGSVYGDPYQWPLIYKANKSKISDADLIYPGQIFDIDGSPSSAEVKMAVTHARTRGAWSAASIESSDRAYLSRN
ncbi:MAG TPA: LysM peptidoglycan-binding domain-containing protein [Gammaproteobacteria bacterium]|nr:LysM peptidoglycan-binding domain-containing protein [Gammaproteobacteria bacterium]